MSFLWHFGGVLVDISQENVLVKAYEYSAEYKEKPFPKVCVSCTWVLSVIRSDAGVRSSIARRETSSQHMRSTELDSPVQL